MSAPTQAEFVAMSETPHSAPHSDLAFVTSLIRDDAWMMETLRAAREEALPDWWIVAGFVRARVWDVLHAFTKRTPPTDIDLVFFDRSRPESEDRVLEERLGRRLERPWEVVNQAHIHSFNGNAPYTDSVDSFSRWAETVSTIGVRLGDDDHVRMAAPWGLSDLLEMVLRPGPHPDALHDIFEKRLVEKAWHRKWPRVRVVREPLPSR